MKSVKYIFIILLAVVLLLSFNQKSVTSPTANEALPINSPIQLIVALTYIIYPYYGYAP
jgi:hypothetical protein